MTTIHNHISHQFFLSRDIFCMVLSFSPFNLQKATIAALQPPKNIHFWNESKLGIKRTLQKKIKPFFLDITFFEICH